MPDPEWSARPRAYAKERTPAPCVNVEEHPLQPKEKPEPKPTGSAPLPSVANDPLSMMAAAVADDPLSMMAAAEDPLGASGSGSTPTAAFSSVSSVLMGTGLAEQAPASRFLTWKQRRADILKQYAVTGQIKIQSDLLNVDGVAAASLGSNLDDGAKAAEKKVDMLDAKTRGRLEQLVAKAESGDLNIEDLTDEEQTVT